MNFDYWQKQGDKPLFSDIEWNKPEQKHHAGKLGIVGGNKDSFAAVARGFKTAEDFGAGTVRCLVPDALEKLLPASPNLVYAPSNPSGGFSKDAATSLLSLNQWADAMLLIGDLGKNSETAVLVENFVLKSTGQLLITRDAVDLLLHNPFAMLERPDTTIFASFAQLQKIFARSYYPKILTFSMTLANIVEALHKFTITHDVAVATLHEGQIIVASGGRVTTTNLADTNYSPLTIWSGEVAVKAALYEAWNPGQPLESITTSLL